MNLLQKIKSTFFSTDAQAAPEPASFATRSDTIYAPTSGVLVSIQEINDEVIASGLLGDGYGIIPVGNTIYAPADGRVDTVTVTNHAVGIMTKTGIEVLIHVGIDTVNMEGKGFVRHVEANQEVSAGTPLLSYDPEAIKAAGYEDMVTVVISNPQNFRKIDHVGSSNTMIAGRPLVKIGDPLLVTRN